MEGVSIDRCYTIESRDNRIIVRSKYATYHAVDNQVNVGNGLPGHPILALMSADRSMIATTAKVRHVATTDSKGQALREALCDSLTGKPGDKQHSRGYRWYFIDAIHLLGGELYGYEVYHLTRKSFPDRVSAHLVLHRAEENREIQGQTTQFHDITEILEAVMHTHFCHQDEGE